MAATGCGTIEFLLRAKRATYAGGGAEAAPSRPGSRDYRYEEGGYVYVDSYLGGSRFAGGETVWAGGAPVWAMNYVGRALSDDFSVTFLKEALALATAERPYRGPANYEKGDYTYTFNLEGDLSWFYGYEFIKYKGETVYECAVHGGEIT